MKRLLFSLSALTLMVIFSSSIQAKQTCYKWDESTVDQKVGTCTNLNYEKLIKDGGPRQLICTNMNYPLYWTCYNIHKDNGVPTSTSLHLEVAAEVACGCKE